MSVSHNKRTGKYQASYRLAGRTIYCGYFNDVRSALGAIERRKNPTPQEELAISTEDFTRLTAELLAAKIRMERAERAVNESSASPQKLAAPKKLTKLEELEAQLRSEQFKAHYGSLNKSTAKPKDALSSLDDKDWGVTPPDDDDELDYLNPEDSIS